MCKVESIMCLWSVSERECSLFLLISPKKLCQEKILKIADEITLLAMKVFLTHFLRMIVGDKYDGQIQFAGGGKSRYPGNSLRHYG